MSARRSQLIDYKLRLEKPESPQTPDGKRLVLSLFGALVMDAVEKANADRQKSWCV